MIPYIAASEPGDSRKEISCAACPVCGFPTQYQEPELICSNPDCSGKVVQRLLATSRVFEVDSLAEATLKKVVEAHKVKNWYQILCLQKEDWLELPGFGDKSAEHIMEELEKSKKTAPETLLGALNIPGVGKNMAKVILRQIPLEALPATAEGVLQGIPGGGPAKAKAIRTWFEDPDNADLFTSLFAMMDFTSSTLEKGKTICFTGKMDKPRSFYEELAREKGYTPVSTVTKDLGLLVTTELDRASSKMTKAKSYGISIVTLDKFLE